MTASTSGRTMHNKPRTIGELRSIPDYDARTASLSVKNEIRRNLLRSIEKGETLFPGVHGYEDTVVPQIVNALLSRHNFILLGLRGQAKSRILRGLVQLLDPEVPVVAGCEINDDPLRPICRACREKIAEHGDNTPIAWMPRDQRFVEKLATPDVTIADIIGDVDPIRAARRTPCVYRESGGLYCPRQNHHSPEGSHRRGDSHALSIDPRRRNDHHPTRSLGRARLWAKD